MVFQFLILYYYIIIITVVFNITLDHIFILFQLLVADADRSDKCQSNKFLEYRFSVIKLGAFVIKMGENYSDVKISVIVIMSKSTLDQWSKFLSSVSAQVEINYRFDCQTGPVTQLPFLFRGSAKKEMYPRDKATVGQVTFHSDSDILLLIFVLLCCSGWDIGPRREELADVWIDHGAFNDTLVRNYMHPDTLLIACVREPVSWFKSATKYFSHTRRYVSFINTSPLACLDKLALLVVGLLVSPSHYQQALSRQANFTI